MILTNVFFIFEFMTNVISEYILMIKGLDFNTQKYRLHKNDVIYDYARSKFDYYFMKNNIEISIENQYDVFFDLSFSFFVTSEIKYVTVND